MKREKKVAIFQISISKPGIFKDIFRHQLQGSNKEEVKAMKKEYGTFIRQWLRSSLNQNTPKTFFFKWQFMTACISFKMPVVLKEVLPNAMLFCCHFNPYEVFAPIRATCPATYSLKYVHRRVQHVKYQCKEFC